MRKKSPTVFTLGLFAWRDLKKIPGLSRCESLPGSKLAGFLRWVNPHCGLVLDFAFFSFSRWSLRFLNTGLALNDSSSLPRCVCAPLARSSECNI